MKTTSRKKDDLKKIIKKLKTTSKKNQTNFSQQRSTGNLTNTTTKNILAQLKKSTLFGCDIIVN